MAAALRPSPTQLSASPEGCHRAPPVIDPGVPVSAKHLSMPPSAVAAGVLSVSTGRANEILRPVGDGMAQKRQSSGTRLSWAHDGVPQGNKQQQMSGGVRSSYIERELHNDTEDGRSVDREFDMLLDKLQVPPSLRAKLAPLEFPIKQSMLESSQSSRSVLPMPPPSPARKTPRKAKSSSSLRTDSPASTHVRTGSVTIDKDEFVMVTPQSRGQSTDIRGASRSKQSKPSIFSKNNSASFGKASGSTYTGRDKGREDPAAFVHFLSNQRAISMDVDRVKTLRMLLRHESTQWVQQFVYADGYKAILATLQQLLDVEWREEQHDDQLLYELLRCIKALSTSEVGKQALRHSSPYPWPALSALLFSEKKPGDLPTRQIILDLWLFLFDLYPAGSSKARETPLFVKQLLIPEIDDPTKDHHDFVKIARRPRVFKAWVGEMSDICRDYFWIMCHGSNQFWALEEVDDAKVEKPVAPGGATGGVEYEAMNYVTTHFRLLNTLSRTIAAQDRAAAKQFHDDLMQSGMDRILVTIRKASTAYYPTIHLELARYVAEAKSLGSLPTLINRLVASPPDEVRRFGLGGRTERGEWLPMPATPRGGWDMQS